MLKVNSNNSISTNQQIIDDLMSNFDNASINDKLVAYTYLSIFKKSIEFWSSNLRMNARLNGNVSTMSLKSTLLSLDPLATALYLGVIDACAAISSMNENLALNPGYTWAQLVATYPPFQDSVNLDAALASAVAGAGL